MLCYQCRRALEWCACGHAFCPFCAAQCAAEEAATYAAMDAAQSQWGALIERFAIPGITVSLRLLTGVYPLGAGNECLLNQARAKIRRAIADVQQLAEKLPAPDNGMWVERRAFWQRALDEDAQIHPGSKGKEK